MISQERRDRISRWWYLWWDEILIGTVTSLVICLVIGVAWYLFQTTPAPLTEGDVVNESFIPAHWEQETRYRQQYAGQSCSGSGTSRICTSQYISVPYQVDVFYDDDWNIAVDGCSQNRRGDTICRVDWIDVSQYVYDDCDPGEFWRRETACRLL